MLDIFWYWHMNKDVVSRQMSSFIPREVEAWPDSVTDRMIGNHYTVLRFVREENHGLVLDVGEHHRPVAKLEAKAYSLRGIPKQVYKSQVRNMKRLSVKPSFLCYIDSMKENL